MTEMEEAVKALEAAKDRVRQVGIESCRALFLGGFRSYKCTSQDRVDWWNEMIEQEIPLVGPLRWPRPAPADPGRGEAS